jgi:4-cresol dehydrogenase (hydroxylating)
MYGTDIREAELDSPLQQAIAAWQDVLGTARVIVAGERLELAQRATFAAALRSVALLEPASRDEVADCLRIANRYRVPIHPISGGRNWGYGSKLPPRNGAVLLSLARMERILEFSEELAYVTIEPGVTFRALTAFLRECGSSLLPPMTGTSADASIVGNVLERGIGKGLYEDMAAHSCGYEIVLATGEAAYTGFAGYPGAPAAALRAHGPGPSLQGMFQQSHFGIVTRMTIWLEPAPAWRQKLLFPIRDAAELAGVIDSLRGQLLRSGSGMQAELINDYRLLAMNRTFPFDACDAKIGLPRTAVADAIAPAGGGRWFGCATLWGDSEQELAWRRNRLSDALGAVCVACMEEPPMPGRDAAPFLDGIRSVYWRKQGAIPADPDPDRDRCGVIWLAPVLPMLGSETAATMERVESLMLDSGFEPSVSLRMIGGRSIQAVIGILYDREEPGADERAASCHAELRELLNGSGLYPYRLGLLDIESMPEPDGSTAELLHAIKRIVDPNGIISSGRYVSAEKSEKE